MTMAVLEGDFYSNWNIMTLFCACLMMEAEIIFVHRISKTDIWLKIIEPRLPRFTRSTNGNGTRIKKGLIRLGYVGLLFGTAVPFLGLGKISTFIFATSPLTLRFGRIFLYAGAILKIYIYYYYGPMIYNHIIKPFIFFLASGGDYIVWLGNYLISFFFNLSVFYQNLILVTLLALLILLLKLKFKKKS